MNLFRERGRERRKRRNNSLRQNRKTFWKLTKNFFLADIIVSGLLCSLGVLLGVLLAQYFD